MKLRRIIGTLTLILAGGLRPWRAAEVAMKARKLSALYAALLLAAAVGHAQTQSAPQQLNGVSREQASFQRRPDAPKYAPDRLIVRFRPGTPKSRSEAAHAAVKARSIRTFKAVRDMEVVRLPEGAQVEAALQAYRKDPSVLYAEPDYVVHALQNPVTPNDPRFGELWGLQKIQAPEAWGITTGSSQVVVAVIDSGVDYNHPDLNANMFRNSLDCNSNGFDDDGNGYVDDCYGIDTANDDSDPMDDAGHGTHVAGTIGAAGNNGIGVVGVNWQVRIVACKFLGAGGYGYDSDGIACLDYVAALKDAGVNVVATNNSWGGADFSQALLEAIGAQWKKGILFIASAGNSARNNDISLHFPSDFYLPNIIAVGATTKNNGWAEFSNFGRRSVHIGAPGVDILSTTPADTYSTFSGTSMAAPHVTGVAALLAAQDPTRDWKAIKNLILAGGDSHAVNYSAFGGYRLNQTVTRKYLNASGAMTCSDSTILSRLQPRTNAITSVSGLGLTVNLAVLHINCAAPGGDVTVLVDGGAETITLLDDGQGTDQEAGDGIYSGQWVPPAGSGTHTLTIPNAELDLDTDAAVVVDDVISVQILSPYRFSTDEGFNYRQITGTQLFLDDDDSQHIDPGFPILFGGGSGFGSVFVNSNGNITFTGPFDEYFNQPIPVTYMQTLVAPFWDDLSPPGGDVFWDVLGSAPNRELVIEWRDVPHYDCQDTDTDTVRFQVVFFEGSSDILFNYADAFFGPDCEFANLGGSATVGVQVAPQIGTQFSFNTPSLADGTTLLWTLGAPTPVLTRLSPFTALAGESGLSLRLFGSGFVPQSEVRWNGSPRPTVFVNSNELAATIPASDLTVASTAQISVSSPEPGGGASNELPLTVYDSYPVPSLTSLRPSPAIASGCQPCPDISFTLTVTGTDFVSSSVVRWNGADRPTTALSATQVQAEIPFADVAEVGSTEITVFTPAPGGGLSNPLTLAVQNPVPLIAFVEPPILPSGVSFTFRVTSGNVRCDDDYCTATFVPSSVVRLNGADRPTTFINGEFLEAAISASDLPGAGTAEITVFTPAPGGGISNALLVETLPRPPNDDFANALAFSTLPFTHTVDIRTATVEPADLPFMGQALSGGCLTIVGIGIGDPDNPVPTLRAGNTVWYKFTPGTTMTVSADMIGTNYEAYMAALTGAPGSLTLLRCTQSTWDPPYNRHVFTAQAGQTYYFVIGDYTTSGTLVFNLYRIGAGTNAVAVTRAGSGTGTVTSSPSGINCGPACSVSFTSNMAVTLTATPASGSVFSGWGGACTGSGSCSLMMDATKVVTAVFNAQQEFGFGNQPAAKTVTAGQPAQFMLEVHGQPGFAGTVSFACTSGVPQGAACSFNPASVSLGGGTASTTLTVTTTSRTLAMSTPASLGLFACWLLPLGLLFARRTSLSRRGALFATLTVLLLLAGTLAACGGGSEATSRPRVQVNPNGTPAGTHTIMVTGTSGSSSQMQAVTLVVN